MSQIPVLKSKSQIYSDLVDAFLSKTQTANDLYPGSVLDSLFQAVAEAGFSIGADTMQQLAAIAVDRATGETLKKLANDKDVPIYSASSGTGFVAITDTSFTKIEDRIYSGAPGPVPGQQYIYVADASTFPSAGRLFIGRGTDSSEGPLQYGTGSILDPDDGITTISGIVPKPNAFNPEYYIVVLNSGQLTTKFHNVNELVTIGQGGDRTIQTGTVVSTKQSVGSQAVQFTTTQATTILDGEIISSGIPVVASVPGVTGNVSRGAITTAQGLSFTASVYNDLPIVNARSDDTDQDIRDRIKAYEQSKAKGTEVAIKNAAVGVTASDELKRVLSANVERVSTQTEQYLIIDDGTGYEPIDSGVGIEQLVDSALGGEQELQFLNPMVRRASVKTLGSAPYALYDGDTLTVSISGNPVVIHTFGTTYGGFKTQGQATAYEVVASINANPNLLYEARTIAGGTQVVLSAKTANEITVEAGGANDALNFPTTTVYSARLYKNDTALYQDGQIAIVETKQQASWGSISSGATMTYQVDGTDTLTITIQDVHFQKYGPLYSASNGTSLDIWAKVLNDRLPGVETIVDGTKLRLQSRSGSSSTASIKIVSGGTLSDVMFDTSVRDIISTGITSDYTMNLKTGQVQLATPLVVGDQLTAGSQLTVAKIETYDSASFSLSSNLTAYFVIDGNATFIPQTLDITLSNTIVTSSHLCTFTAPGAPFANVQAGDWLIFWKEIGDASNFQNLGAFRVRSVISSSQITFMNHAAADGTETVNIPSNSRLQIVRSDKPVQKVVLDYTSVSTPAALRDALNSQLSGATATVVGNTVRLSSDSLDESVSQICIASITNNGSVLNFSVGIANGVPSHAGYIQSTKENGFGTPSFKIFSVTGTNDDNSIFCSDYINAKPSFNELIQWVNQNGAQGNTVLSSNNRFAAEQIANQNSGTGLITFLNKSITPANTINVGDQFITRQGLMFDSGDTMTFIIDGDLKSKAYSSAVARRLKVTSVSTPSVFSVNDDQSALNLNDPSTFKDFNFNNFKIWMRAKNTIQGVTFKYKDFGPTGSNNGISFQYPAQPNAAISHVFGRGIIIPTIIKLGSGAPRSANWASDTTFTVGSISTAGTIDTATLQYRNGTAPNFSGAGVQIGDIVSIADQAGFLSNNRGTFKITSVGSTSLGISAPTGTLTADAPVISNIVYPNPATVSAAYGSGRGTITTTTNHNLSIGQKVGIYGTNLDSVYGKVWEVKAVPSLTTFEVEFGTVPGGSISTVNRTGSTVTITLTAPHTLTTGMTVKVSNTDSVDSGSFNGIWTCIAGTSGSTVVFTQAGTTIVTSPCSGRVDRQPTQISAGVWGNVSKGIQATQNLKIFPITSTTSDVVTYVNANLSDFWEASATGSTAVQANTQAFGTYTDSGLSMTITPEFGGYERKIAFTTSNMPQKGAIITMQIPDDSTALRADLHNIPLQVLRVSGNTITVRVSRLALPAESPTTIASCSFIAIQDVIGMGEAQSHIQTYTQSGVLGPSSINLKPQQPLNDLALGDQIYAIATNAEQLARFTAKQAVSGLSNVADVTTGEIGYKLQVKTKTFGSNGSVRLGGGRADSIVAAVLASGVSSGSISGVSISKDIRLGIVPGSFVQASNTNTQFKTLGIDSTSSISLTAAAGVGTILRTAGSGSFQTKRSIVFVPVNQKIKFEKHGDFVCVRQMAGTSMQLAQNIKEGDWVQIRNSPLTIQNTIATGGSATYAVSSTTGVIIGQTASGTYVAPGAYVVSFVHDTSVTLSNTATGSGTANLILATDNAISSGNQGIFQVQKIFGDNFWIKNTSFQEQASNVISPADLAFYSYDSVMPGDKLKISGTVLGSSNVGTYIVSNDLPNFTSSQFTVVAGNMSTVGTTVLSGQFNNFQVEEAVPFSLVKKVIATGPTPDGTAYSWVGFTTPDLSQKISSALGGTITSLGKLGVGDATKTGLDAYRYYTGLLREVYYEIYGDPSDASRPGVRAAGTDIDIKPPLNRRITTALSIRIRSGVAFTDVIDAVRSAATGYINSLGVGESLSISEMISRCQQVDGVISVTETSTTPTPSNGLVKVAAAEVARVIQPSTDVSITVVAN